MSALFLPFAYPAYPKEEVARHIEDSKEYLRGLGVDFTAAPTVTLPGDVDAMIKVASAGNFDYCIVLLSTWVEAPNITAVLSAAGLESKPLLLWSHDNVYSKEEGCTISFGSLAIAGVMRETFEEFGYKFKFVIGNPGDPALSPEITAFDAAARTVAQLKRARLGMAGYASMGMYTGLGDHIKVKRVFGTETVHIDQYSILAHLDEADAAQIEAEKQRLRAEWEIAEGVEEELLTRTAKLYLRMKELIAEERLSALTVKCQYEMSLDFGFTPCVALSLLGEDMPISCEGDIYLLLSQMILAGVSGKPTAYGDMLSLLSDGMICAACGFAPKSFLAPQRPHIGKHTALYFGMLITSPFKAQKVTVVRLANRGEGFKLHLISGHTEELRDFHEIGCPAYAGSVIRFDNKSVADFKNEVMSQHYAIVPGDHVAALTDFCNLMDISII